MNPTAAPAYFPYAHRTMAEIIAFELADERFMLAFGRV